APGDAVTIQALHDAVLMALGGEPVGPRYIDWNFVSSPKERIEQAREDWAAGRMQLPDLDDAEFIPLPPGLPGVRDPAPMSWTRALAPRHGRHLRRADRLPRHVRLRHQRRAGGGPAPA